jgi:hypothetical protein
MAAAVEGTGVIECNNNIGKQVFGLVVGIVSKFFPAASFAKGITCSGEGKQLVIYHDDRSSLKTETTLAGFIVILIVVLVVVKIFK